MPFEKGHKVNSGVPSRRKEKPNKITKQTKDLLASFVNKNMEDAQQMFNEIESPAEKLKILSSMLKYVVPTLNSVTINDDAGRNVIREILENQKK